MGSPRSGNPSIRFEIMGCCSAANPSYFDVEPGWLGYIAIVESQTSPAADSRNPWRWIPSLYFAQGIPYVIVMTVAVIMYKRLGVSNKDIAFFTSVLYLPWVIKPLW